MNLAENIKRKSVESELDIFDAEFGENIKYEKKLIEELLTKAAENGEFECIINVADMHHIVYQVVYKWLKNEGFTVNTHKPYSSDDLKDLVVALEVKWVNPTKSKEESKKPNDSVVLYQNDNSFEKCWHTALGNPINTGYSDHIVTLCSNDVATLGTSSSTCSLASSMSEKAVSCSAI